MEGVWGALGESVMAALISKGIEELERLIKNGGKYVYDNKDRILSEVETLKLTKEFAKELKNGEDLDILIQKRLPASPKDVVRADTKELLRGIHDAYEALASEIDDAWIEQHLNRALGRLNQAGRVRYLRNLIRLFPQEFVAPASVARMEGIMEDSSSEDDVAFLIETARDCINQDASVMVINTVRAAEGNLKDLSQHFVDELGDSGVIATKAYAAARYILNCSGKKLWNQRTPAEEGDSYSIGVTAVANVEKNRLIVAYNKGKITLEKLKTMAGRIGKMVWSLLTLPLFRILRVCRTTVVKVRSLGSDIGTVVGEASDDLDTLDIYERDLGELDLDIFGVYEEEEESEAENEEEMI